MHSSMQAQLEQQFIRPPENSSGINQQIDQIQQAMNHQSLVSQQQQGNVHQIGKKLAIKQSLKGVQKPLQLDRHVLHKDALKAPHLTTTQETEEGLSSTLKLFGRVFH